MHKRITTFFLCVFVSSSFAPAYALKVQQTQQSPEVFSQLQGDLLAATGLEEGSAVLAPLKVFSIKSLLDEAAPDPNLGIRTQVLVNSPNMHVSAARLVPGQGMGVNEHPDQEEYYYVVEGVGEFQKENDRTFLHERAVVPVPANTPHALMNDLGQTDLDWLIVSRSPLGRKPNEDVREVMDVTGHEQLGVRYMTETNGDHLDTVFNTEDPNRDINVVRHWDKHSSGSRRNPYEFLTACKEEGPQLLIVSERNGEPGKIRVTEHTLKGNVVHELSLKQGDVVEMPPEALVQVDDHMLLTVVSPHPPHVYLDQWPEGGWEGLRERLLGLEPQVLPILARITEGDSESILRNKWAGRLWRGILGNIQKSGAIMAASTGGYSFDWPRDSWEVISTLIRINRDLQSPELDYLIRAHIDFIWYSAQMYGWHPFTQKINLEHGFTQGVWSIQPDSAGLAVIAMCAYSKMPFPGQEHLRKEYYRRSAWFAQEMVRHGWDPDFKFNGKRKQDLWEQVDEDRYLSSEWVMLTALGDLAGLADFHGYHEDGARWRQHKTDKAHDSVKGMAHYVNPDGFLVAHRKTSAAGRRKSPALDSGIFTAVSGRTAAALSRVSPIRDKLVLNTFRRMDEISRERVPLNDTEEGVFLWIRWKGDPWRETSLGAELEPPWYLPSFWRVEFIMDYAEALLNVLKDGPIVLEPHEREWLESIKVDPNLTGLDLIRAILKRADTDLNRLLVLADQSNEGDEGLPEQVDGETGVGMGPKNLTWVDAEGMALLRRRQKLWDRVDRINGAVTAVGLEEAVQMYQSEEDGYGSML